MSCTMKISSITKISYITNISFITKMSSIKKSDIFRFSNRNSENHVDRIDQPNLTEIEIIFITKMSFTAKIKYFQI